MIVRPPQKRKRVMSDKVDILSAREPRFRGGRHGGGAARAVSRRVSGRHGFPHGAAVAAEPAHRPLLAGAGGAEARPALPG